MLSRCAKCGTSWSSLGLPICPICGASVPGANGNGDRSPRPETKKVPLDAEAEDITLRAPSSAVLEIPRGILKEDPRGGDAVKSASSTTKAVREAGDAKAEAPIPSIPPKNQAPSPATRIRLGAAPPAPKETDLSLPIAEKVPAVRRASTPALPEADYVDPSVLLDSGLGSQPGRPGPARPLNGPLILGLLGILTVVLLPWTLRYESHRIFGVLGFCMSGFFLPFAPIAWVAGLSTERRRREQGLRPEARVLAGRVLGQCCTLLLIAELSLGLVMIAALRLGGNLPASFWAR